MADGKKMPIEAGLIARVAQGLRFIVSGNAPESWFGPLNPLDTTPVPQQEPTVTGRRFDYPTGFNIRITPRSGETIDFPTLRALADSYDLLRLVIETRKDQISKFTFSIMPKVRPGEQRKQPDKRCHEIEDFMQSPDKENSWDDWLRMLLEDMLVIDAATIFPRKTYGEKLYALEVVDGGTISRKLDQWGRTPIAPETAYQQVLKGVPAVNYSTEDLIYMPRNKRSHKVYGFSPVEQIIVTTNIALRRQTHQLQFYTEGSTPDLVFSVPKEWTTDQIRDFKQYWDSLLVGNTANRRGTMFVPEGTKPINTKEGAITDAADEWLARLICFAFSISPQALQKMMNRATAETAKESAEDEGLAPMLKWVKGVMDRIISQYFGYTDLEFVWDEQDPTDPKTQSEIIHTYLMDGVLTPAEARAKLGMDPLTPSQMEELHPAAKKPVSEPSLTVPQPTEAGGPSAQPAAKPGEPGKEQSAEQPAAKIEKADVPRHLEETLGVMIRKALAATLDSVQAQLFPTAKDDGAQDQVVTITDQDVDNLDLSSLNTLATDAPLLMSPMALNAGLAALRGLSINSADITALVHTDAVEWAKDRAAELVGMRYDADGNLIPNPDAQWQISDTTREMIRGDVGKAIAEGWSNQQLSRQLVKAYAFSADRAMVVARTESALADNNGSLIGYKRSGVVKGKEWILAQDEYCDICAANAQQGEIPLDASFSSGQTVAPAHPNCRCDVVPVVKDKE